jgi:hypothetical protein
MGRWLRMFGESIYGTRGGPYRNGEWGGSCYRDRTLYLHVFQWAGDTLRLPPLKARVLHAGVLAGGPVEVEQTNAGLTLSLAAERRDETDTVIKLELDAPVENEFIEGKPLEVSSPISLTLRSPLDWQVFQRQTCQEGEVRVCGRALGDIDRIQVRFTGASLQGDLAGEWMTVAFDRNEGSFDTEMRTPVGAWLD